MKVAKKVLQELANGGDVDNFEFVQDEITGKSRWSIQYELIFKHIESGKFYSVYFERGATEYQDTRPFEYEPDEIECQEVEPRETIVITYIPVK